MSYSSEVLADSPLVYLQLDDSSGTTAVDSSGNSRDMTSANCTLAQATVMPTGTSSYDFNGTSSQISLADAAWQRPTAMTVEAWIRLDSTTSFKAIAAKDGAGSGWAFYSISGKLSLYCNGSANTGVATMSTGTTYHVAATFDSGTVKLYINGALDQTFTSKTLTQTSGTALLVGVATGSNGGASRFFWLDGREDEFAYYGTALSGTRILDHYNAATGQTVVAPTATATAAGLVPTVGASATVTGVAASATALGLAPVSVGDPDANIAAPAASASAEGLTPTVTGDSDAAVSAPPATASAEAVAPSVAADGLVAATVAEAAAAAIAPSFANDSTVVATVATATADAIVPFVDDGSGSQTVVAPPATATAAGLVAYPALDQTTDTSNFYNGRRRSGYATVEVEVPVEAPPYESDVTRVDKAVPFPDPVLVKGRPT